MQASNSRHTNALSFPTRLSFWDMSYGTTGSDPLVPWKVNIWVKKEGDLKVPSTKTCALSKVKF